MSNITNILSLQLIKTHKKYKELQNLLNSILVEQAELDKRRAELRLKELDIKEKISKIENKVIDDLELSRGIK